MTPEQKRIAIAEACGWKIHPKDRFIVIPPNSPHSVQPLYTIPDYFNDLNAMHEAEKVLSRGQLHRYMLNMQKVNGLGGNNHWLNFHATAEQRAEAFGKTLNLW
jgi:hypothetical protein